MKYIKADLSCHVLHKKWIEVCEYEKVIQKETS